MLREEYYQRIKFIVAFGKVMHTVGTPAHTLEAAMMAMCEQMQLKGSFISLPTAIFFSFRFLDEEVTRIVRTQPTGVNLGRLSKVDTIAQEVISGRMSIEEGEIKLEEVFDNDDKFPVWMTVGCFVITSAGMLTLFGGSWGEFIAAGIVGGLIGLLSLTKNFGVVAQVYEVFMALMSSLLAALMARVSGDINVGIVILATLIIFMPGLNITIALAEIATQNLTSGTSRLMGGMMVLLKLTFGVFIGSKLASYMAFPLIDISFGRIPSWVTIISVPITALMSTVIFKSNMREAKWVTFAGVFGYAVSKIGTYYLGPEMGLFVSGLSVGAAANLFARLRQRPSSIFQFPGIILLVPGSMGYRGLSYLYEKNVVMGFDTAFTMLTLAFSLVMGIFIGNVLIKPRRSF